MYILNTNKHNSSIERFKKYIFFSPQQKANIFGTSRCDYETHLVSHKVRFISDGAHWRGRKRCEDDTRRFKGLEYGTLSRRLLLAFGGLFKLLVICNRQSSSMMLVLKYNCTRYLEV